MLAYFALHLVRLIGADIRRIGDDDVKIRRAVTTRSQQIAFREADSISEAKTLRVFFSDGESVSRNIHRVDLCRGQLRGQRDGNAS